MRADPRLVIQGNIPLLLELLDPDRVGTFLQNIDFQDYETRAAKTSLVIRILANLSYSDWKSFLKFLKRENCPAHRDLGRILSYVSNRPSFSSSPR